MVRIQCIVTCSEVLSVCAYRSLARVYFSVDVHDLAVDSVSQLAAANPHIDSPTPVRRCGLDLQVGSLTPLTVGPAQ